jgi:hypothetical protein
MKIELQTKLLKLKGILNDISHASFSYSQLGRQYQLHTLDNEQGEKVIRAYEDIIETVKNSIMKNENTYNSH